MIKVSVQTHYSHYSTAAKADRAPKQELANTCALVALQRAPAPAGLAAHAETPTQNTAMAGQLPGNQVTVQVLAT